MGFCLGVGLIRLIGWVLDEAGRVGFTGGLGMFPVSN